MADINSKNNYPHWKLKSKTRWKNWTRRRFQNKRWYQRYKVWARNRRLERRRIQHIERIRRNFDEDTATVMEQVLGYTMIPEASQFALIEAVRYVNQWKIPGSFVECGVWRGGATMSAVLTMKQLGETDRLVYLYDTFSGMTEPKDEDSDMRGKINIHEIFRSRQTGDDESDWCRAGLDDVKRNMAKTGYPFENFIFVEGKVEDTLPNILPDEIAILRLDTDWYESTKQELIHLFPRLVSKGVIIVDDYYTWTGSKQAVDEYLDSINCPIFLKRVEDSVIGIKP